MGLVRNGENSRYDAVGLRGLGANVSKSFPDAKFSIGDIMFNVGGSIEFTSREHGGDHIDSVASHQVAEFENSS